MTTKSTAAQSTRRAQTTATTATTAITIQAIAAHEPEHDLEEDVRRDDQHRDGE